MTIWCWLMKVRSISKTRINLLHKNVKEERSRIIKMFKDWVEYGVVWDKVKKVNVEFYPIGIGKTENCLDENGLVDFSFNFDFNRFGKMSVD